MQDEGVPIHRRTDISINQESNDIPSAENPEVRNNASMPMAHSRAHCNGAYQRCRQVSTVSLLRIDMRVAWQYDQAMQ